MFFMLSSVFLVFRFNRLGGDSDLLYLCFIHPFLVFSSQVSSLGLHRYRGRSLSGPHQPEIPRDHKSGNSVGDARLRLLHWLFACMDFALLLALMLAYAMLTCLLLGGCFYFTQICYATSHLHMPCIYMHFDVLFVFNFH